MVPSPCMFDSEEHAALLAAVRARPDHDEPRLEYARWLEQSRRAGARDRAELIRVQLALASPRHPDATALEARELELLRVHATQWLPEHPALRRVRFRRGFIEYAHLHLSHYLHHRRQLRRLAPVRALSLTGWSRCNASLVERVAACEELADIESLAIHHQGPHKSPRDAPSRPCPARAAPRPEDAPVPCAR